MIKRAVIHIGIEKTGSTTIQKALFSTRSKLLSDAQILYPSMAANQSVYLGTMFRDKAPPKLQLIEPDATDESSVARVREKFRASLEADIADPGWHTLVISAESLCDFCPKAIARFIEWLTEYVSDISVVAYVRHPVDWTRSVVQERLKQGDTLELLYKNMRGPSWRQRFTPWLDAVGLARFRLVSFEDARENDGIMASFCAAAGLPRETILSLAPTISANESMSLEAALLLDSLNRQRPMFVNNVRMPRRAGPGRELAYLRRIKGRKFDVPNSVKENIPLWSCGDVAWLNETFGLDLYRDIVDFTPHADSREEPVETLSDQTVDSIAEILGELVTATVFHRVLNGGKVALAQGNLEQAAGMFQEAARLDPDAPQPKMLLEKVAAKQIANT